MNNDSTIHSSTIHYSFFSVLSKGDSILTVNNLDVGYKGKKEIKTVLKDLNLALHDRQLTCLLGPNGSGKSTLIRSITGIQKALSGSVEILHKSVFDYSQKEMARKVSMVLTDRTTPGNLTCYALVSLGRFPYTSWMGNLAKEDKDLIYWALEATGTVRFANRHVAELSDGERQKIMIARALVQDTPIIILDEPTAHLDQPNRIEIFHLLKELAHVSGKAILMSTHDLDLAIHQADFLWLVTPQQTIVNGVPEDLVLAGQIEAAFKNENLHFDYHKGGLRRIATDMTKNAFKLEGPELLKIWTQNALERVGLEVLQEAKETISISGDRHNAKWQLNELSYTSIQTLIESLTTHEEN